VTDLVPVLVVLVPAIPLVGAGLALLARTARQADRLAMATAVVTAVAALILACTAFARGGRAALHGRWYLVDGASGLLLGVIAVVGLCSALVSPSYLRTTGRSWTTAARSRSLYYAALFVFWAALLAVPVAGVRDPLAAPPRWGLGASGRVLTSVRSPAGSKLDPFRAWTEAQLQSDPRVPLQRFAGAGGRAGL